MIRQRKLKEFIEDTNIDKKPGKHEDSNKKKESSNLDQNHIWRVVDKRYITKGDQTPS